ncbi:MAG: calcium/sodium antiporter [Bacteroidales bacterium]
MINILLLILGLALILIGANYLVDGSSHIAKRFGISDFIIGMTIVGIGTSTPEMVVSFISAINGNADIAVGNIVGSNIFNAFMILGMTALLFPVKLTSNNIQKDIPFALLAAFILCIIWSGVWLDSTSERIISRTYGIILLCFFGVFMAYTIFSAKSNSNSNTLTSSLEPVKKPLNIWLCLLMVVGGLTGLIYGGHLFVNAAGIIAKNMGISDAVIALTIMAGGTSLPELAASLVAAKKKKTDLALGNIIGSNVSNIFLILGGSALITPLSMENMGVLDMGALLLSSILIFITAFTFKKKQIDRIEGAIFIILYVAFIWILLHA